jgi:vancomycin resistance protein YoaR
MRRIDPSTQRLLLALVLLALPVRAATGEAPASSVMPDAFPVTLGSFSTTLIGSSPARTQNVRLAANALDGLELAQGEELSFNRQVGPRDIEHGYQPAPVILHETRQMQTGGGVCQVASTLFVAALVAGLSPVERWRHSTPVDYIALGEDATIAWGAKDLKMRNDLDQRVRLRAEVLGSTLTVRIEGEAELPQRFELETVERETTPGLAAAGREIELYRLRKQGDDAIERQLLHRDRYPPSLGLPPGERDR